jgi:hypothetical protein
MSLQARDQWWDCCYCLREVNTQIWGWHCPECSHQWCENCNLGSIDCSKILSYLTPRPILHERAPQKRLHIALNNVYSECFADTGCEINCISYNYAKIFGGAIIRKRCTFSLPIIGCKIHCLGQTTISVRFLDEPWCVQRCTFWVFNALPCNVLVGRQFLERTGTLVEHAIRLRPFDSEHNKSPLFRSIGHPQEYIQCWLNCHPLKALVDTGAEVNLISTSFLCTLDGHGDTIIVDDDQTEITFADGSTVQVVGRVDLMLGFSKPTDIKPSIYQLLNNSKQSPKPSTTVLTMPRNTVILESFYVVADLKYKVVLGETLLATVDAYNTLGDSFAQSRKRKSSEIAVIRKCKKGEKRMMSSPYRATVVVQTDQEQFNEKYSVETDRHEALLETINNKFIQRIITEDQYRKELEDANREHKSWAQANRDSLLQYCPRAYDDIITPTIASAYTASASSGTSGQSTTQTTSGSSTASQSTPQTSSALATIIRRTKSFFWK